MRPLTVGITGGIGSGKTLVSHIFEKLGVQVYYADDRAKSLMLEPVVKDKVIESFGPDSYFPDGALNRTYLAKEVFNDSKKSGVLNSIVHPVVAKDFVNFLSNHQKEKYILKEAALIFESGSDKQLDFVINIEADPEIRLKRVMLRDPQRSEKQIEAIMQKQLSEQERKKKSNFTIENNGKQLLIPQVIKLHNFFNRK